MPHECSSLLPRRRLCRCYQPVIRALRGAWPSAGAGLHLAPRAEAQAYERIKCDVPNVVRAGLLPPPTGMWADISQGLLGLSAYLSMLERRKGGANATVARGACLDSPARRARGRSRVSRGSSSVCSGSFAGVPRVSIARYLPRGNRSTARAALHRMSCSPCPTTTSSRLWRVPRHRRISFAAPRRCGIPSASIAAAPDAQVHASVLQPRPSMVLVWNEEQRAAVLRDRASVLTTVVVERRPGSRSCAQRARR